MKLKMNALLAALSSALLLVTCAAAQSQTQVITPSQSLGDYARTVRKDKKSTPAKQYDNDNLPVNDKLSIVGSTPAALADNSTASADASAAKPAGDDKNLEIKPGQTPEERQKIYDQWKQKIASQKDKIDLAARELDVTQREYELRAAAFYADAGDRLRNQAAWDKEDANYKDQLAQKQKALNDAKQQLDDLQEQARKAGAPSSVRE
jgi:hypothetical protein